MAAVADLKEESGDRSIVISGSVSVVRQLPAAGLVDELHLLVHPIAVRTGMRLFDEGEQPIPLLLPSSPTFRTGVLNLRYACAESIGDGSYEAAKAHLCRPEPQGERRSARGHVGRTTIDTAATAARPARGRS